MIRFKLLAVFFAMVLTTAVCYSQTLYNKNGIMIIPPYQTYNVLGYNITDYPCLMPESYLPWMYNNNKYTLVTVDFPNGSQFIGNAPQCPYSPAFPYTVTFCNRNGSKCVEVTHPANCPQCDYEIHPIN